MLCAFSAPMVYVTVHCKPFTDLLWLPNLSMHLAPGWALRSLPPHVTVKSYWHSWCDDYVKLNKDRPIMAIYSLCGYSQGFSRKEASNDTTVGSRVNPRVLLWHAWCTEVFAVGDDKKKEGKKRKEKERHAHKSQLGYISAMWGAYLLSPPSTDFYENWHGSMT